MDAVLAQMTITNQHEQLLHSLTAKYFALKSEHDYYFLKNGGEMGVLTRQLDWAGTAVGDPAGWSNSLRNTVGILLNSRFPMFLFWGKEHTCFYNDAYRPSLGNDGKHPSALGRRGIDVFPEIWKDINPLIEDVFAGKEAIMNEDLLLPIYRNGQLEDVYWTFCYSAVFDDDSSIAGVLVVCQETKPQLMVKLKESETRLNSMIQQAPVAITVLRGKDMIISTVNETMLAIWGKEGNLADLPLKKALPELEGQPFLGLLDKVYQTGEAHYAYAMPATLVRNGQVEQVYSDFVYSPLRDADNKVEGIMMIATLVTEQVLSRKRLEVSEAKYRSLMSAAPIAIAVFMGRELVIENPNQAFIDMLERGPGIAGKPLREAMPELVTENQPFLKILDDVFTSGVAFTTTGTEVSVRLNGEIVKGFYDFSYTPLLDDNGNVYAILELAVDVTAQVTARELVKLSEQNLRNIIVQAPAAMAILKGKQWVVEIANDKMYELWGKSAGLIEGRPVFEGLYEAAGQGLEELLEQVYDTGIPYHGNEVPMQLPRKTGVETAYVNFVYQPYRDADGRISGIMVLGTDVTEQVLQRKKLEENSAELNKTSNRLQLAIEAGELGMYEVDIKTDELVASARFNEIYEMSDNSLRADYLANIHPEDRGIRDGAHVHAIETGILNYTVRLLSNNGQVKWIRARGVLTYDENGQPARIMGLVQDITESKELEFQKDSFLGIASHELKTPVTSIKGYVQVMEKLFQQSGQTKYADMMGRVDKQVNRLNYLITDLLDVTKINSGRLQLNTTTFDFDELVKEVSDDIQRVSLKHTLHQQLNCGGSITGDRERIIQVITNLVNNAIKYSPDADRVNIITSCKDSEVTLCVEDFGIGIPEEKKEKVFEQFYRVSGTKEHTFPGLGLGLYISAEIIKRMGGRIWVNSVKDKGSTFCFAFPMGANG